MNRRVLVLGLVFAAATFHPALAFDHSNLDAGRPLRIEDPYAIAAGEIAVEAGVGYQAERRESDKAFFPLEMLYGACPGLQLGVGSTLSTDPREIDEPHKSGDVHLSALYNFNQETLWLPAFGLRGNLNLPTGVRSAGVDAELKGLVTRSFGRLSLHFNPAYEFISDDEDDVRNGRYSLTFGASYPVGAPHYTRTLVLADIFAEQAAHRGDDNHTGVEIGFRHQLTLRSVWDLGLGSEWAGPAQRSPFFLTTGLSLGF